MTKEKILSVTSMYRERLIKEEIPKKRMDPRRSFSSCTKLEILSHVYFLLDGVDECAKNPEKLGKTGRHLGSAQTLLGIVGWYTLEDVMNHNRPNNS